MSVSVLTRALTPMYLFSIYTVQKY